MDTEGQTSVHRSQMLEVKNCSSESIRGKYIRQAWRPFSGKYGKFMTTKLE